MNSIMWLLAFLLPVVFAGLWGDGVLTTEQNEHLQENCGVPPAIPSHRRTRRSMQTNVVARSEAPWVVKITRSLKWRPGMSTEEKLQNVSTCSGSLISPRHVITAAHCVGAFDAKCDPIKETLLSKGSFGKVNLDRFLVSFVEPCEEDDDCKNLKNFTTRIHSVKKIFVSSAFTGFKCTNRRKQMPSGDAAILLLAEDVEYSDLVYPVCLNDRKIEVGEQLTLFGYGTDGVGLDGKLRKHVSSVKGDCKRTSEDTICHVDEVASACEGDSGGGSVIYDEREVASLAGLISGGASSCMGFLEEQSRRPSAPEVHSTAVDKHVFWICAATGVCPTEEVRTTAEKYDKASIASMWFQELEQLKGNDIYV